MKSSVLNLSTWLGGGGEGALAFLFFDKNSFEYYLSTDGILPENMWCSFEILAGVLQ